MNKADNTEMDNLSLLPHQKALIDDFFADPSMLGHIVLAEVGLGSFYAAAHLIKHMINIEPAARILILVNRKILQAQLHKVLSDVGVNSETVDRYRYREKYNALLPYQTPWQEGKVFILGLDFASQEDIVDSICSVPWALLVVPDAHQLRRNSGRIVQSLFVSSPHVRVLFLSLPDIGDLPTFGFGPWTKTVWRRNDIVDAAGHRLFKRRPIGMNLIEFQVSTSERHVQSTVMEIVQLVHTTDSALALQNSVILRSMRSSWSALEETLRRLRHRLVHGDSAFLSFSDEQDAETDADDLPSIVHSNQLNQHNLLRVIDICLADLDFLVTDSKLDALTSLLKHRHATAPTPQAFCIITDYRATLLYLQTVLEELGFTPYVLYGAMAFDERSYTAQKFKDHGGILVITTAMLTAEFDARRIDEIILYDYSHNLLLSQGIYGRLQAWGSAPLTVHLLFEETSDSGDADIALSTLRKMLTNNQEIDSL